MKKMRFLKRCSAALLASLFLVTSNIDPISILYESNFHPIKNVAEKLAYWAETGINPFNTAVYAADPDGSSGSPFYVRGTVNTGIDLTGIQNSASSAEDYLKKIYDATGHSSVLTVQGLLDNGNNYLSNIADSLRNSNNEEWLGIIDKELVGINQSIQNGFGIIHSDLTTTNSELNKLNAQIAAMTHNYRVANIVSLNNIVKETQYKPYFEDVPYLDDYVKVSGQFAATSAEAWNINVSTIQNPGKLNAARAYEILGYDAGVRAEGLVPLVSGLTDLSVVTPTGLSGQQQVFKAFSDQNSGATIPATNFKYVKVDIPEKDITWLDAVTVLYKALSQEQSTYDLYIAYNPTIKPENSSVYQNLSNISAYDSADKYNGYNAYVFVTRSNYINGVSDSTDSIESAFGSSTWNLLYWNKAVSDGFIYDTNGGYDKWNTPISASEFFQLAHAMMVAYGEPEMSDSEQKALLQVYGASYPIQLGTDVADAWAYLKCRGILVDYNDVTDDSLWIDPSLNVSKEQLLDVCMKIKDKDSRDDYKVIQITLDLADVMQENGYYPVTDLKVKDDTTRSITTIKYNATANYDYMLRMKDDYDLGSRGSLEVCYRNASGELSILDGASVKTKNTKWQDAYWYYMKVPKSYDGDLYIRKVVYDENDNNTAQLVTDRKVDYIKIAASSLGGGIYNNPHKNDNESFAEYTRDTANNNWYSFTNFGTDESLLYLTDKERAGISDVTADASTTTGANRTWLDHLTTVALSYFAPLSVYAWTAPNGSSTGQASIAIHGVPTSRQDDHLQGTLNVIIPAQTGQSANTARLWIEFHNFEASMKSLYTELSSQGQLQYSWTDEDIDHLVAFIGFAKVKGLNFDQAKTDVGNVYKGVITGKTTFQKYFKTDSGVKNFIKSNADMFGGDVTRSNDTDTLHAIQIALARYMNISGVSGSQYDTIITGVMNSLSTEIVSSRVSSTSALSSTVVDDTSTTTTTASSGATSKIGSSDSYEAISDYFIETAHIGSEEKKTLRPLVRAKDGTEEQYLNRMVLLTTSSTDDASNNCTFSAIKTAIANGDEISSQNTYAVSGGGSYAFSTDEDEDPTFEIILSSDKTAAYWIAGGNPLECATPYNKAYSRDKYYDSSDLKSADTLTLRVNPDVATAQSTFGPSDPSYEHIQTALTNHVIVNGTWSNSSTDSVNDMTVRYTVTGSTLEQLTGFIASIDEGQSNANSFIDPADSVDSNLDTSRTVFSDAIMNREEVMLVKWSDLVACGYVTPTPEEVQNNGPTLTKEGYYQFYTPNGRVRVNNTLQTIQIGTTLFDLSTTDASKNLVLIYQGEKDENGAFDTYIDYRCILGIGARAKVKDDTSTEIVNNSIGNGNYAVYRFDTSTVASNIWQTQSINAFNFPETSADNSVTSNIGYPAQTLNTCEFWDNKDTGTQIDGQNFIYWGSEISSEYPRNRFMLGSFYPTANWACTVRDGGDDGIKQARLYIYYPIQAFTEGFQDTTDSFVAAGELQDYWENAPWHSTYAGDPDWSYDTVIDKATQLYQASDNLKQSLDSAYPDDGTEATWYYRMTKYAIALQYLEFRKLYYSPDYIIRVINLSESSVIAADNKDWLGSNRTQRTGNDIGAVYWLNYLGFVYNMPYGAAMSSTPFRLSKYFSGEYALPIAMDEGTQTSTVGIVSYNMDYYGSAYKKAGSADNGMANSYNIETVSIPYGYSIDSAGWVHYTQRTSGHTSAFIDYSSIPKNGDTSSDGILVPPFVMDSQDAEKVFNAAPTGIYHYLSGYQESADISEIYTYATTYNQFYLGSRRIVLNPASNDSSDRDFAFISNNYNAVRFNTTSFGNNADRVYRNRNMDIFVVEKLNAVKHGDDVIAPIDSESLSEANIMDMFDKLGMSTLIKSIDNGSSFLIILAFTVLPMLGIILMTILVGLSFISQIKFVQVFCEKFFDPIRILTFGNRDINNWSWKNVLVPCVLLYTVFALFLNGNIIRLVMWLAKWYGVVSQYFYNRF